jgi:ribosomal 50S subunit-recycling heat shock protein
MRLDKFLKVSRIIKRRTVANEACAGGCVKINGKTAKPSSEVKPGDVLELTLGQRAARYEVVRVTEHALKQDASAMYRVLGGEGD